MLKQSFHFREREKKRGECSDIKYQDRVDLSLAFTMLKSDYYLEKYCFNISQNPLRRTKRLFLFVVSSPMKIFIFFRKFFDHFSGTFYWKKSFFFTVFTLYIYINNAFENVVNEWVLKWFQPKLINKCKINSTTSIWNNTLKQRLC